MCIGLERWLRGSRHFSADPKDLSSLPRITHGEEEGAVSHRLFSDFPTRAVASACDK